MKMYNCLSCDKECVAGWSKANKYCSNACQREHQRHETYQLLCDGQLYERKTIRNILTWKHGRSCFNCKLSEWCGHPIPLELDHKDGDASNNSLDNLAVLCPNCHGITDTWKGRNRGSGRKTRGLSLS